jgi:hypothetical protein
MKLKESGYNFVDWNHPAQDRVKQWAVVNMTINIPIKGT